MSVLKREAADALAALGASHALITSARLAQVQRLRPEGESGGVTPETLMAIAADYQGWQNDQVRLFDALSLIMRMRVPQGLVLDQMDPALHSQARSHLEALNCSSPGLLESSPSSPRMDDRRANLRALFDRIDVDK